MNDPLAVIYNEGYWRVNKVSPMYDLQYSELKLKQYATKIRQALVSDIATSSGSQMMVSIESLPLLKYSHEDPNGLQITVSSCSKDRLKSNNKEVYVAILLSWGSFINVDDETTHLPYMLERGERRVGEAVKNTMQTVFDCIITLFNFTKVQLMEFVFNLLENDTSKSSDSFVLRYKTPQVNFKDNITLTFEIGDVRAIWNGVKEVNNIDEGREKRSYAYQILQNQIYHMYKLDVTVLHLCEVGLPKAEVKSSGLVKMKTPEIINSVFNVLNGITHRLELTRQPILENSP
ncbi:uncharacterized protein LOC120633140 [Pararge aegeria]|uniref:Centromere protein L n=2 Tax=Pararge aegeria TaxID=116150 RepID=A0A8S4SAL9_9NEOP|nr:uncharacterized protein LOC120633140 [Pararge aegeria]CAH2255744.1 jg14569 [Pararge aegeria aegeria]